MTDNMLRKLLFVLIAGITSLTSQATEYQRQTFQTCNLIASEQLTAAQLYLKGLPLDALYDTLPNLSDSGKQRLKILYQEIESKGPATVFALINSQFSKCARMTIKGSFVRPRPSVSQSTTFSVSMAIEKSI